MGLQEYHRLVRDGIAQFAGMLAVVAAYANDLHRLLADRVSRMIARVLSGRLAFSISHSR